MSIVPLCPVVPSAAKPQFPTKPLSVKHFLLINLEREDKGENLEKREDHYKEVISSNRWSSVNKWVAKVSSGFVYPTFGIGLSNVERQNCHCIEISSNCWIPIVSYDNMSFFSLQVHKVHLSIIRNRKTRGYNHPLKSTQQQWHNEVPPVLHR